MATLDETRYANVTIVDIELASAYYPILLQVAKRNEIITYGDLVANAKLLNSSNATVQNAIAVSAGRRLDVVRIFTDERDLPDLTSLVVNKTEGECGSGFLRSFDPIAVRSKVYGFDWSSVSSDFNLFLESSRKITAPKKKITEDAARKLAWDHFSGNKESFVYQSVKSNYEEIIKSIMDGTQIDEAFAAYKV